MTQRHISVIDWAFRVFMQNYTNETECHCKIGKIRIGNKEINPKMFERNSGSKEPKMQEVWS